MGRQIWSRTMILAVLVASCAVLIGRSPSAGSFQAGSGSRAGGSMQATAQQREKGGQEEFGPYDVVENWPQPLPDGPDGIKHDGWTWGSIGAVFAETADRIWIAQRGELPLPPDAKP